MEISPGIEIINTALWLRKEKNLIINDLHLGFEEALRRRGIFVPKLQLRMILNQLQIILEKVHPAKIIINGDLKHEFGTMSMPEWREVLKLLDVLQQRCPVVIIKGNNDQIVEPLADKRGVAVVNQLELKDILIVHGDVLVETKAKRLIIGHEHPAITLRDGSKREKYKCFLKGKWKGKEIIAVPSLNPLLEGTDVLKEEVLSPFLENIQNFEVYIVSKGEVYRFGKVKDIP